MPVQLPAWEPEIVFAVVLVVDFGSGFISEIDAYLDITLFSEYFSLSVFIEIREALVRSASAILWGRLPIRIGGIPIGSDITGVNTGGDGVSEISEHDSAMGRVGVSKLEFQSSS